MQLHQVAAASIYRSAPEAGGYDRTERLPPRTEDAAFPSPSALALIVPTFNEPENIAALADRIKSMLTGIAFELIVVDDNSRDGTAYSVRQLGRADGRIRCVQRIRRRGLSSAVIEGIRVTTASIAAVIDGDLQHDESQHSLMLRRLTEGDLDVVVGSIYMASAGMVDWPEDRQRRSRRAVSLARFMTKSDLTDPISGFFMVRTDAIRTLIPHLSGVG